MKLRMLVSADVHIDDYLIYSKIIDGVPSRLLAFLKLADILKELALSKNIDAFVLAGDLSHKPMVNPRVSTIIRMFVEKIAGTDKYSTIIIDGNHDKDSTVNSNGLFGSSEFNIDSILRPLIGDSSGTISNINKRINNNLYYNTSLSINGIDLVSMPYKDDVFIPEPPSDTSVLIGHGIIKGSKVNDYMFGHGYNGEELSQKYLLSIFGDVHEGDIYYNNILVPGPPIQANHKDPYNTGVWIVDIADDMRVSYEFIPIIDDAFIKFVTSDDRDKVFPSNHVVRIVRDRSPKPVSDGTMEKSISSSKIDSTLIKNITISVLSSSKNNISDNLFNDAISIVNEVLDHAATNTISNFISVPNITLRSVSITNFSSITDEIIITDFDQSISILGDTGSGKTSILEAICWCLYGECPGMKFVDDIINDKFGKDTHVKIVIEYSGIKTIIDRYRNHSINSNKVMINNNVSKDIDIVNLVSLTYDDFKTFIYYSQGRNSFLTTLSLDKQLQFFKLFNVDITSIDSIISSISSKLSIAKSDVITCEAAINSNQQTYDSLNLAQSPVTFGKLSHADRSTLDVELVSMKSEETRLLSLSNEVSSKRSAINSLVNSNTSAKVTKEYDIKRCKDNLLKVEGFKFDDNVCSVCPYHIDYTNTFTYLSSLYDELDKVDSELSILNNNAIENDKLSSTLSGRLETVRGSVRNIEDNIRTDEAISNSASYIETMDNNKASLLEKITNDKTRLLLLKDKKEVLLFLNNHVFNKGLKSLIVNDLFRIIADETNELIKFSGCHVKFMPETTQAGKTKGGIETILNINGKDRTYHRLSGGQKLFIDLAITTAYINLVKSCSGFFNFLMLDEVCQYFDPKFSEYMVEIFNQSKCSLIVTTHIKDFKKVFRRSIDVVLEDSETKILSTSSI